MVANDHPRLLLQILEIHIISHCGRYYREHNEVPPRKLELPGKKDRDGYVITTRDVERLEKILAENEKMLFSKRAGDEKSNDSENTQQAKASDRYTKYVLVVSCLVVLELLTGLADWVGMFNLYVFIPPLFLLYEIQRNIKQITTGHPDEARNKEEYAMALWELYKGKLGV